MIEEENNNWCSDDWETPDNIARAMVSLLKDCDRDILEPAAGTGQITKFLPNRSITICCEKNEQRFNIGRSLRTEQLWYNRDFLSFDLKNFFDVIITNPPFSMAMEFIEHGLNLLCSSSNARLLYLLPNDFFCSNKRAKYFQKLDCHINHRYLIKGRVAYLKNGTPQCQRQIYDCVFDIRKGQGGRESYLPINYFN